MANILDPLIQRIQVLANLRSSKSHPMMQYDAKLNGEQKLEHFKSLRRNRSSNDKLLNYDMRRKTRRVFAGEVIAGEKVKRRAVIDSGTVRREKVQ